MATATNRAALQTALLSVRGLRRRRLGHISPTHYPQNGLDKWGRKKNNNDGGVPSNLLAMGGVGRRPAPRASLVLGGEMNPLKRRNGLNGKQNGLNGSGDVNGKGLVSNMMEQQRTAMANTRSYVNGASHRNAVRLMNDPAQLQNNDVSGSPNASNEKKSSKHKKYSSDLVVVLDMDECLIHSQFLSDQLVDKYRQVEDRPSSSSSACASSHQRGEAESMISLNTCDSFRINLPDGDQVNVNKRPNLDLFLREITSKFETYIFTAAMEVYAAPVLDKLDPHGEMFHGRFYREHCAFDPDLGVYAKDLCDVMRMRKMMINNDTTAGGHHEEGLNGCHHDDGLPCDERRVVLVDNNPLSFLPNPSNGILVSSFYDDPKDDTLEAVMELLHELDESDDVRPILDDRFGLKDALNDVVKGASVGW